MRDPDRIALVLAALERRWRRHPDLRLTQMLVNLHRAEHGQAQPNPLFGLEDGELLSLLGAETEAEKQYIADEPAARKRGWREWERGQVERRKPADDK